VKRGYPAARVSALPERFRRLGWLLLLAPVLVLVLGAALSYVWNDDFWWYVGSGEAVLRAGEIPDRDPLLYTAPTGAWVYHSWLSTVLIAVLVRLGGIGAAVVWSALAAAALIAVVYTTDRADRYGLINALAALLVVIAAGPRLYGKVEILSWLFFAVFFRVLDRASGYTPRGAAALGGLQLLWANLHGGYPLGIFAAAAYAVGDQLSRWRRRRSRPAGGAGPRPWPLWLPVLLFGFR
jgi:hypothetical protein